MYMYIYICVSKKPAAIPPPRNVLVLGSMRPVEEGHTQGDIFKLLIRLIQRQLQERNFLQRCGDEVPKAATNPEKFHSLHYPGRSLETLFRMDFDRICSPWCGHLGTILSWPNDMVVFRCYDATRFCIVVAHVLTLLHICNLPGLLSFLWQCAFQCRLDSSVFVFLQLQCRQSGDELVEKLEVQTPCLTLYLMAAKAQCRIVEFFHEAAHRQVPLYSPRKALPGDAFGMDFGRIWVPWCGHVGSIFGDFCIFLDVFRGSEPFWERLVGL